MLQPRTYGIFCLACEDYLVRDLSLSGHLCGSIIVCDFLVSNVCVHCAGVCACVLILRFCFNFLLAFNVQLTDLIPLDHVLTFQCGV